MKIKVMMITVTMGALVTPLASAAAKPGAPLPATAKVAIGPTKRDLKDVTSESCASFRVSEKELRLMFETYRPLTSRQVHDDYVWAGCFVDGTISLQSGKSFTFRVRPGNTLETNFPSGKPVILGGTPTDSPSGE